MKKEQVKIKIPSKECAMAMKNVLLAFGQNISYIFYIGKDDEIEMYFTDDDWTCGMAGNERKEVSTAELLDILRTEYITKVARVPLCKTAKGEDLFEGDKYYSTYLNGKDLDYAGSFELKPSHAVVTGKNSIKAHKTEQDAIDYVQRNKRKPLCRTVDGKDLFEGDDYARTYVSDRGRHLVDTCTNLKANHAVVTCYHATARAHSTLEQAQAYADNMNKPEVIIVNPESHIPAKVSKDGVRFILEAWGIEMDILIKPEELKEIAEAFNKVRR